eukprot:3732509-Prymnesium_polylepis.1
MRVRSRPARPPSHARSYDSINTLQPPKSVSPLAPARAQATRGYAPIAGNLWALESFPTEQ